MEEQVEHLVQRAWAKYQITPQDQRLLIAISGMPGSGKTTLARTITTRLNTLALSQSPSSTGQIPPATYIPMDGFHYSQAHLATMPDPTNAFARRGAPFTFDADALLSLVTSLREPLVLTPNTPTTSSLTTTPVPTPTPTHHAPSFSHTLKDPLSATIPIPPTARLLLLEGNYLSLNAPIWSDIAAFMDELWFVDVDENIAARRLVSRHVRTGVAASEAEAWERVRGNDLLNGREIVAKRVVGVGVVVRSEEDGGWVMGEGGVE